MNVITTPGITGLILAGGLAQRMGGGHKGLRELKGRPLIQWAVDRLRGQVDTLIISSNDATAYAHLGLPMVADELPQVGPLGGMLAGLKAARTDWIATVPCDAPQFPLDLVTRLKAGIDAMNADLGVACTADGLQPVFCLMRRSKWPLIRDYLATGRRRADGWYGELQVARVEFEDAAAFTNINTPEALAALNAQA